MDYTIDGAEDGPVIRFSGRFTHADRTAFRQALTELGGRSGLRLVLDLAGLDFIDSSALGMLLLVREHAGSVGRTVVLRGAQGQVQKLIGLTRFSEMFLIED